METKKAKSFTYSFHTSRSPKEIFELLLEVDQWWSGLFEETITGKSHKLNDEFSFNAGGGQHYSTQKLIELETNQRIVWLVTESNLSFLKEINEWEGSEICFDLSDEQDKTTVTFTHNGIVPGIECYDGCAGAWTQYMEKLEAKLN